MKNIFFLFIGSLVFFSACSDPTSIGAGLLQNEEIILDFTDTVFVDVKTIRGDSLSLYNPSQFSLGQIEDNYFGKTSNLIYLSTSFGSAVPEFSNSTLDSVVLKIPYDISKRYGDTLAMHTIEIFQLNENYRETLTMLGVDSIFSNTYIEFDESNLLGERTLVPGYDDTLDVYSPVVDSVQQILPHLRIRIDDLFGQQFLDNASFIESDTTYQDQAKGFVMRSTPQGSSYMGIDLSNAFERKLVFYYTKEGEKRLYEFDFGNISHGYIEHDYSGSVVQSKFDDPMGAQDLLFQESYDGSVLEIEFPGIIDLADKAINYAVLEFTLADIPDLDLEQYPAVPNLTLSYINSEGNLVAISDITSALSSGGGIFNLNASFGGNLKEDDNGNMIYSMNITNHIINLLDGEFGEDNFKLIATNLARNTTPNRSIIYGNGSTGPNPKLKIVITEP